MTVTGKKSPLHRCREISALLRSLHGLQGNLCSGHGASPSPSALLFPGPFLTLFPSHLTARQRFVLPQIHFPRGTTSFTEAAVAGMQRGPCRAGWSWLELAGASCVWHGAAPDLFSQKPAGGEPAAAHPTKTGPLDPIPPSTSVSDLTRVPDCVRTCCLEFC